MQGNLLLYKTWIIELSSTLGYQRNWMILNRYRILQQESPDSLHPFAQDLLKQISY